MTKLIIVVKMSCELLYIIQVKGFLINSFTFFALLDIKAFGRLSLDTMLLLIGLTLFTTRLFLFRMFLLLRFNNRN